MDGPVTINTLRYRLEPVEIEGTYVKEVNQYGEVRYQITEPCGHKFEAAPNEVTLDSEIPAPGNDS